MRAHDQNDLVFAGYAAVRTVPEDSPTTLDYGMHYYVDHLDHHLAQVFA